MFFTLFEFSINIAGINFHYLKHRFSEILKTDFFRKNFKKTAISPSQSVDNTENEKINEI